jgi:cell division protein FtsN
MEQPGVESGTELVLDNRKLIVGFVLLVALCGACFVIGFMEGKRQATQAKADSMPPAASSAAPGEGLASGASKAPGKAAEDVPAKDRSIREQLDWYKNVQRGDTGAAKSAPKTEPAAPAPVAKKTAPPPLEPKGSKPPAPAVAVPAAKVSYSVQVGAFRQLKEAETTVAALKAKGFEAVIDPPNPKTEKQLYLVKVGKFELKADATVMQHKLTKAGISCFIRTN